MADTKSLLDDDEFISDFVRFSAGILDEKFLRRKYHFFDERDWERLGADDRLAERIETERLRKTRDGSLKRELAAKHIIRGPAVLATIMDDPTANARHRVDSIKALDQLADPGPARAPTSDEKYSIVINLGADHKLLKASLDGVETIDARPQRRREPVNDPDTAPLLALIAAKKDNDDGSRGGAW